MTASAVAAVRIAIAAVVARTGPITFESLRVAVGVHRAAVMVALVELIAADELDSWRSPVDGRLVVGPITEAGADRSVQHRHLRAVG